MSSGRMLDTVENVAAYYGPAVFVFFAACFGRVLWAAGDGRATLSPDRIASPCQLCGRSPLTCCPVPTALAVHAAYRDHGSA